MSLTAPLAPLAAYHQWIVVQLVPLANGKTDKWPIDYRTGTVTPKGSGGAHNPEIWLQHSAAEALAARWGRGYTIGFVITAADPFWCLDVDSALQPDGTWSRLALDLVAALPGTAVEVSQSGRGLHIWGQGVVPPHAKKRVDLGIELYDDLRFIAIGSNAVGDMSQPCPTIAAVAAAYFPPDTSAAVDTPDTGPSPDWRGPTDDADLIRRAMQSRSAASAFGARASFADLWLGDVQALARAYPPDPGSSEPYDRSSADAALAQHLAFWTGRDVARIERLMRQSALVREKWDNRDDYLVERTIRGACGRQVDVLQDRPAEAVAPVGGEAPASAPVSGPEHAVPQQRRVEGNTFLSADQQLELFKGCVYIIEAHRVLCPGGMLLKPESFKARFGGYTLSLDNRNERTTRNAFEAFTESQVLRAPQANGTCFRPDLPYGTLVTDAGRTRANLWWPIETPRRKGDVSPFLGHLARLIPDAGDQQILLSWMACMVQHPGVKFQCAPFLQGVEGNGKTFFSRCLSEIVGKRYSHWPDASKLGEKFNGWLYGRLLICVEDIHTENNTDILERLKPWITGTDGVEIEGKNVDQVTAEIVCNFIFNSNHLNGIRKTRKDRRYIPFITLQQDESDLARHGLTPDYFKQLYDWARSGGYAMIHEYLATYAVPEHLRFDQGIRAPVTSTTNVAIEAGRTRVEQEVIEAIEQQHVGFKGGWVSSIALDKLLDKAQRGNVPRSQRRDLLRSLGYAWHPALPEGRATQTVAVDGGRPRLYVVVGHPSLMLRDPEAVVKAYSSAQLAV